MVFTHRWGTTGNRELARKWRRAITFKIYAQRFYSVPTQCSPNIQPHEPVGESQHSHDNRKDGGGMRGEWATCGQWKTSMVLHLESEGSCTRTPILLLLGRSSMSLRLLQFLPLSPFHLAKPMLSLHQVETRELAEKLVCLWLDGPISTHCQLSDRFSSQTPDSLMST